MNRTLGVVAVLAIAAVAVYYLTMGNSITVTPTATSTTSAPPATEPKLTTATISESTTVYSIDAQYPQFGVPVLDTEIKRQIDAAVTEIKNTPANPPDMASPKNELTIRFESPYIGIDVISVKLIISEYTGGAHPNTFISGVSYNRPAQKIILQDDAFAMTGMTLAQLSLAATQNLKARLGETMFVEGASADRRNFASFVVGKDAVTFIFQPYQVAAYAAGPQEVAIPRVK